MTPTNSPRQIVTPEGALIVEYRHVDAAPVTDHWLVIETAGGVVQDIDHDSGLDLTIINIDYDELVGPDSRQYHAAVLENIREAIPPGEYRRRLRLGMAEAFHA